MLTLFYRTPRALGAGPIVHPVPRDQVCASLQGRAYPQVAPASRNATPTPGASTRRFTFALSLQLRRDPQSHALQVPRVPPPKSWPSLAYRPSPTFWQDLAPLHLAKEPALDALGALQHWLRTSPTGSDEEREASAYWAVCRAQADHEQQVRARLRRGEGVGPRGEVGPAVRTPTVTGPQRERDVTSAVPAWASAAGQMAELGLIAPELAARAQADAARPADGGAAAAGEEAAWGARLVGGALGRWRVQFPGVAGRSVPAERGGAGPDVCLPPPQAYATCLRELVRVAATQPASLLPAPGTRRQLTVTLLTEATSGESASASPPRPATGAALAAGRHAPLRWDLLLTSVEPDEPGPGATWRLGDALG